MSKLWNKEQELAIIESQPAWIGVNDRIAKIKKDIAYWSSRLEADPKEWIVKKLNLLELDLQFFQNILVFWLDNYNKMEALSIAAEKQVKAVNKGAELLELIDEYKIAYKYQHKENIILSETFIKLAKTKDFQNADIMSDVLSKLRNQTKEYVTYIEAKINSIIDE